MKFVFSRKTIRSGLIILGVFTLFGCFSTIQFWLFMSMHGMPMPPYGSTTSFLLIAFISLLQWYLWALLTPLLHWISRTCPIRSQSLTKDIQINLSLSIAIVVGKLFIDESLDCFFRFPPDKSEPLLQRFFFSAMSPRSFMYFLIYWTIMAFIYSLQYNKKLREREVVSSQLEAQLAQAQLNALKMQLQPHFLFNTLNSISSLLRENVDAADDMITNLSDMLRYSLNNINVQEATLREEIDFLQHYLDIEQIRFQDRLITEIKIDPAALEARVPSMMLQPIVENSIRHGISKQSLPGKVLIHARRNQNTLEITVIDTGAGFSSDNGVEGIGLSNTRERLEKLYGSSFTLNFERSPNHETIVRISIPYSESKNR